MSDADHHGDLFVRHERAGHTPPHADVVHVEQSLAYLVHGAVQMYAGGPVRVEAGSMVVIPAGVPHRSLGGEALEYWMTGFCGACLGLQETQPLMQTFRRVRYGAAPVLPIAPERRPRVIGLFSDLREELDRGAPESPELSAALLRLLLGEVRRADTAPHTHAPSGTLVADALAFIQQRALHPISLRDVAAAVHRSPAHVATTFKEATGFSVGDWIRAVRISEAASWLAHSDEPLDAIAARVGWQDKTHFIRQFRKEVGQTPAAWRRAQRAKHRSEGPRGQEA